MVRGARSRIETGRTRTVISVIIPTLNEEANLDRALTATRRAFPDSEMIVTDGGSADATLAIAQTHGVRTVVGPAGRGIQLVAGAAAARGELLFFLHADTLPPEDAGALLARWFARPEVRIGTFRLSFDAAGPFLRACTWCTRIDSMFTRFGDQGIASRRDLYDDLGGFAAWPLFEDVELLRRARRVTRVWSFPASVTTSARRFRARGPLRQQWLNARLLLRFLAGTPPHQLAAEYRAGVTAAATRATSRKVISRTA